MGFATMTSRNPSPPTSFEHNSPRQQRDKRVMTTEEFDRILQTEPPARLSLVSNRRGSVSNHQSEKFRASQYPSRKPLKKQISFDNFSHKLQHTSVSRPPSRPPRTSLPHFNSYAQLSTTHTAKISADSGGHSHPESDTEATSDTSSTGPTLPIAEKKSISSLIKKTFGKKPKRVNDKDATTSSEQSLPSSPSASLFSISPQPSPVDSIFDHSKTTLDSLRGSHPQRYQTNEEDWTDGSLPSTPQFNPTSGSYYTSTLSFAPTENCSATATPFQLAPAPKSVIPRKSVSSTILLSKEPVPESPRGTKVTFKSEVDRDHRSVEGNPEELVSSSRSRSSSFSSEDSFHTIEEASIHIPFTLSQSASPSRSNIPRQSNELIDFESLKWENTTLLKELEKTKRQLALEQSARSGLLKSMENARSQFDDISAQAYRKLRQVTSENRRLHSQVKDLEGKLKSLDVRN